MSEELFNYNVQTVGKLFNNGMQLLWPETSMKMYLYL